MSRSELTFQKGECEEDFTPNAAEMIYIDPLNLEAGGM